MAAVKNILKHVSPEIAGRRRKCYRKKAHVILKGEPCLVVHDGPQSQTTYCTVCASEILTKANGALANLHAHFTAPHDAGSQE
ncbi:hypothetical protein HGQ17_14490 [Nesterenkonia sp. MY13]|uniref:Uncharacterized protein n=1 Tax=Nesterenkonia sedimenti TaxID=1463632 RepID=A0A7X8YEV2_9MICC|nr:hypothetical protein [Nesterenkonia sedimenti]NLS11183.1 hypothetical protein [Nesterenkonia sedimenti]